MRLVPPVDVAPRLEDADGRMKIKATPREYYVAGVAGSVKE